MMEYEVLSKIIDIEIIASGNAIREIDRLQKIYGKGRWRKMKGFATIRFPDKSVSKVELHWYEAHGIGKKEYKIKRILGNKK